MGLLASFDALIREHGSASILKDHLALLREQIAALENKSSVLSNENAILKRDKLELQSQLENANMTIRDLKQHVNDLGEFTESHGAYFKKDGNGGYHNAVYCGACKSQTATMTGRNPRDVFRCKCGWQTSFTKGMETQIRQSLP